VIGDKHQYFNSQISYVVCDIFKITIGEEIQFLKVVDGFFLNQTLHMVQFASNKQF